MKNKKLMTTNLIAIFISVFIATLTWVLINIERVKNTGHWQMNNTVKILSVIWILLIGITIYLILYFIWVGKAMKNAEYQNYLNFLKDKLKNGDRKVIYRRTLYDKITVQMLDFYNPTFYLRLKDNDTIDIIVKDSRKDEIIAQTNCKDIMYIKDNFKLE